MQAGTQRLFPSGPGVEANSIRWARPVFQLDGARRDSDGTGVPHRGTAGAPAGSLAGTLPPNIRPVMTPPSSIMGQIVVVGLSRQTGPAGGVLAPVGKTGLMAELPSCLRSRCARFLFLLPLPALAARGSG